MGSCRDEISKIDSASTDDPLMNADKMFQGNQHQLLSSSFDEDDFDRMVKDIDACCGTSNSKMATRDCSCSSTDIDWNSMWEVADENAVVERDLIKNKLSKPRKPDDGSVCFKKRSHPGTTKWRAVVKSLANNTEDYPEWNYSVYEAMRIQLYQQYGIHQFLVCCDTDGEPSKKTNGCWYLATAQEILDRTKQRFADDRKEARSKDLATTTDTPSKKRAASNINKRLDNKRQKVDDDVIDDEQVECSDQMPLPAMDPTAMGQVETTLVNLDESLANFRIMEEQGQVTVSDLLTSNEIASPTFVDNLQWLYGLLLSQVIHQANSD